MVLEIEVNKYLMRVNESGFTLLDSVSSLLDIPQNVATTRMQSVIVKSPRAACPSRFKPTYKKM